jgi:cellulose synthase/poly-beta-1,6-N-acetylglucosamine synthase-like glycosyltransferase
MTLLAVASRAGTTTGLGAVLNPRGRLRAAALRAERHLPLAGAAYVETPLEEALPCARADDLDLYLAHRFLPYRSRSGRLWLVTSDTSIANRAWLASAYRGAKLVAAAPVKVQDDIARMFRERLSDEAVNALARTMPRFSASRIAAPEQARALAVAGLLIALGCVLWPSAAAHILVLVMSLGFATSTAYRVGLALLGRRQRDDGEAPSGEADGGLPVYTVLVPLYREANVLPELAEALGAIDYPRDRLDIKFLVEEDDAETRSAAEALSAEGAFEVLCIPDSLPRTKPKACNYGLRFARGAFLVIYDAEDRPERDQLRKAVAKFRQAPPEIACLQARLAIHNATESWLAHLFAIDYAIWFKALLPGLEKLKVPIPLGGTLNHFRTEVLRAAGGWDPFNVTEDADLGLRLARFGHRVAMLNSTTYEEAPPRFGPWLRQRSRWLKGYMQTWLVHMRDPRELVRRVGLRGTLAIQLLLGGAIWSGLVNPVLWLILAAAHFPVHGVQATGLENLLAWISGTGLLLANVLLALLVMTGTRREDRVALFPHGLGIMLYWVLISLAAYRGLWQLALKPFHWEKTPHGQAAASGR